MLESMANILEVGTFRVFAYTHGDEGDFADARAWAVRRRQVAREARSHACLQDTWQDGACCTSFGRFILSGKALMQVLAYHLLRNEYLGFWRRADAISLLKMKAYHACIHV